MTTYPGIEAVTTFTLGPGAPTGQEIVKSYATGPVGTWDVTPVEVSPGVYQASKVLAEVGTWVWLGTSSVSGHEVKIEWDVVERPGIAVGVAEAAAADLSFTVYRGDDYATAEGRQRVWSLDGIPNLAGGTAALVIYGGAGAVLSLPGVIGGLHPGTQTVTVQLTEAHTALLTRPSYRYDLSATLANGNAVTLARDTVYVLPDAPTLA